MSPPGSCFVDTGHYEAEVYSLHPKRLYDGSGSRRRRRRIACTPSRDYGHCVGQPTPHRTTNVRTRTLTTLLITSGSALLLSLLAACSSRVDEPALGRYRATAALPGGEAPFGLEVTKENNRYVL